MEVEVDTSFTASTLRNAIVSGDFTIPTSFSPVVLIPCPAPLKTASSIFPSLPVATLLASTPFSIPKPSSTVQEQTTNFQNHRTQMSPNTTFSLPVYLKQGTVTRSKKQAKKTRPKEMFPSKYAKNETT